MEIRNSLSMWTSVGPAERGRVLWRAPFRTDGAVSLQRSPCPIRFASPAYKTSHPCSVHIFPSP